MQEQKIFSIDELLTDPSLCHGRVISVRGYYVHEFESQAIWNSSKDEKKSNFSLSIWIETDKRTGFFDKMAKKVASLSHKDVVIKGTFIHKPTTAGGMAFGHGHMGGWPAEIQKVAYIQEAP